MCTNIEYRVCKYGWHLKESFVGQITKYPERRFMSAVILWAAPRQSCHHLLKSWRMFLKQDQGYVLWRGSELFHVRSSMTWHDITSHVQLFLCALNHCHFDQISWPPQWPLDMFMHYTNSTTSQLLLSDNKHNCVDQNITLHFDLHSFVYQPLYSPVVTICTTRFNVQQFYVLPTQCIYVFCVNLRINSDYFPIQY